MPLGECYKIRANSPDLYLKYYKGHFATSHSHMNYYIDITENKSSLREARAVAGALSDHVRYTTAVDTVLCLDGTEVIGACLAADLTKADRFHVNAGNDIYVLTPEYVAGSQLYFRDNTAPMVNGKAVLILAASVVTGYTAEAAVEAIRYFGGTPVEICSIFATMKECCGIPVRSVFDPNDLGDYVYTPAAKCPLCEQGIKITALVNSFGCSAL